MSYQLHTIPAQFVGQAWKEGAQMLAKACDVSGGEITGDQLKLLLSRGERSLLRITKSGDVVGWAAIRIDQLPNVRALHVTDLYAPGGHWQGCFELLANMARQAGCEEMRCCAGVAQQRLYQRALPWEALYTTLRVTL
jgi:hypothetical protein